MFDAFGQPTLHYFLQLPGNGNGNSRLRHWFNASGMAWAIPRQFETSSDHCLNIDLNDWNVKEKNIIPTLIQRSFLGRGQRSKLLWTHITVLKYSRVRLYQQSLHSTWNCFLNCRSENWLNWQNGFALKLFTWRRYRCFRIDCSTYIAIHHPAICRMIVGGE